MISRLFASILIIQAVAGDDNFTWKDIMLQPLTAELMKLELALSNRLMLWNGTLSDAQTYALSYQDEENYDKHFMLSLRNSTVRVLARKMFPFVWLHERKEECNESLQLTGFIGEIWKTLEEHLGFRTHIKWGRFTNDNKDWDVLLNPQELSLKKLEKYSYTFPIAKIWYHLYARGRQSWKYSMIYFEILDRKLWVVVLAATFALSAFLWVTWRIRRKVFRLSSYDYNSNDGEIKDINYSTCFLSVLGCMINQGSQFKTEKSGSIRIITLICIVLGLILCTSFSALLISKLATASEESGEHLDLRSLAETPRGRTLCVARSSYAYRKISKGEPHYIKGASLTLNALPYCTPGEHDFIPYQDYCSEHAVILETTYNAIHAMKIRPDTDQFCTVYIYHKRYFQAYLILVMQKEFPYLRIINKHLLRMEESGLMKRISDQWKPKLYQGSDDNQNNYKIKVGFYHIKTIVFLYGAAMLISLIILGMELLHKWLTG